MSENNYLFDFDHFIIELKTGSSDEACKYVLEFLDKYGIPSLKQDKSRFHLTILRIIMETYQAVLDSEADLGSYNIPDSVFIGRIFRMRSVKRMGLLLCKLVKDSASLISSVSREKNTIRKIKDIVEAEYSQELSMKYISEKIFINPVYMGQLFKKETGMPLKDYINEVRINSAKRLLKETNSMSYEIAIAVGFSDPHYFSKVFKKVVGVSPKEYREIV